MNPRVKKMWLEALRSGEYQQGRGALREADKFCCLGVLCDLHAKETGGKWDDGDTIYLGRETSLPVEVCNWADVDRDPSIGVDEKHLSLINDDGTSFLEIASHIEREL